MRSLQRNALALHIFQRKTVGFQIAILFEDADPVFSMATQKDDKLLGEIPTIE
jgi:hypothetical protein